MSLNPFKKLGLAAQLYALVAITLLLAGGLIAHAMMQVKATQGTLKFTIDNRMGSGRDIRNVIDVFEMVDRQVAAVAQGLREKAEEFKRAGGQLYVIPPRP